MKYFIQVCELLKEIKNTDWFSKNDLFITINIDDEMRRTTVKWNNNTPVWNEQFIFDIDTVETNTIVFSICDEDSYSKSETLVTEEKKINLNEIIDDTTKFLKIKHGIFELNTKRENDKLKLENEKLKLENEKLKLENEKLKLENEKLSTKKKALKENLQTLEKSNNLYNSIIQKNDKTISSVTNELNSIYKNLGANIINLKTILK
jgi:hypothetical protein